MRPVVDGLQASFGERVEFRYVNALDAANGQAAFEQLGLLGHPSYIIFDSSGQEVFRTFGVVPQETLRDAIVAVLADG